MTKKDLTLSIETAVQGGSISLLQGMKELDHWVGQKEVSKSEDVLEEVKNIFIRNDLKKDALGKIVISKGPGSHTGLRIGISIGLGLKKALNCLLTEVNSLEAMLSAYESGRFESVEETISAVPIGKNQVCWQKLDSKKERNINIEMESQLCTVENFFDWIYKSKLQNKKKIIMHRKLYLYYRAKNEIVFDEKIIIDAGENIALLNALFETK